MMSKHSVMVFWSEADEAFVAICPELGGVSALGSTRLSAVREMNTVLMLAIESYEDRGLPVPQAHHLEPNGHRKPAARKEKVA